MQMTGPQLLPLLKQYFGFTSFRPLQQEIIRDALGGKDVFALLPTGGGKSLCFQLPAMARPGLTVVVMGERQEKRYPVVHPATGLGGGG